MSGFFAVYRFFNLASEAMLDDLIEKGRGFCERTWEVAKNSVTPQPFIEQYCFRAPYVVLLLRKGLHILDREILIGSGIITWTFGVALLEAGKASSSRMGLQSYQLFHMKINAGYLIAILFISLFFLVCALLCVGKWIPRFFRRSYIPLYRQNSASPSSGRNVLSPFSVPALESYQLRGWKSKDATEPYSCGYPTKTVWFGAWCSGSESY